MLVITDLVDVFLTSSIEGGLVTVGWAELFDPVGTAVESSESSESSESESESELSESESSESEDSSAGVSVAVGEVSQAVVVVLAVTELETGGSREQVGDTLMVLVAVSVTVTGSQVGLTISGGVMGPAPEQTPSRTKNLEVWAWIT